MASEETLAGFAAFKIGFAIDHRAGGDGQRIALGLEGAADGARERGLLEKAEEVATNFAVESQGLGENGQTVADGGIAILIEDFVESGNIAADGCR